MKDQLGLFGATKLDLPEGFRYQPAVISHSEEAVLLEKFRDLPFKEFEFHGFTGKRRTVSFGWRYDFGEERLNKANDMPEFLLPIREAAANFAEVRARDLQHALVTEYSE